MKGAARGIRPSLVDVSTLIRHENRLKLAYFLVWRQNSLTKLSNCAIFTCYEDGIEAIFKTIKKGETRRLCRLVPPFLRPRA